MFLYICSLIVKIQKFRGEVTDVLPETATLYAGFKKNTVELFCRRYVPVFVSTGAPVYIKEVMEALKECLEVVCTDSKAVDGSLNQERYKYDTRPYSVWPLHRPLLHHFCCCSRYTG